MKPTLETLSGPKAVCLQQLKIPPHADAYWHLLEAMRILERAPTLLASPHKLLYPEIAHRCGRSLSSVEKAIRLCIRVGWAEGALAPLRPYLQKQDKRPTNSEFLSALMIWYAHRLNSP